MAQKETAPKKEKIDFKAEVAQVLNLVVNSLYSHKEVFLRELISNASDAIDKHRHLTMTDEAVKKPESPYAIHITPDKEKKTLSVSDNGIGMTREEVIANLGTIASSGTKAFLENLGKNKESGLELIGQFGVGFYSAFMVADKVVVETRGAAKDAAGIRWESDGTGGYTLEDAEIAEAGTKVILFLKEDASDFLEEWTIRSIVKKYSDYVSHPILYKNEKGEEETLNKVTAIWRRPKSEIKEEEYNEFYKYISHDMEDPLAYTHHVIEGVLEFRMLLFVPQKAPLNFYREDMHGIRLHVKKMFITDQCKELLPAYLRFVKGVVDSEDLPLNVSRETLQQDLIIPKIRKQLTKKVLDLLSEMAEGQSEKYAKFFKELGMALKEGITMDFENREKLIELLRYPSSKTGSADGLISLKDYVDRMKPDQKEIYYISGQSYEHCETSPHLELFKSRDIEVLFMTEVVDEWSTSAIGEYKGKKLKSVTQGDLDLDNEETKKEKKEADTQYKKLTDAVCEPLKNVLKEVRVSVRLKESPACLVTDDGDMDVKMGNILKAMGKEAPVAKRILEINPEHPVIKNMKKAADANDKDPRLEEWAWVLYNQALLAEGSEVKDPAGFVKKLTNLLAEATAKI